jgi:hypothetical protein
MTIVTQHLLTEDKFHEAEEVEMLANWPTEDMILICFFFLTLFRFDIDMPKPKVSSLSVHNSKMQSVLHNEPLYFDSP